jgi:hypothetical protein
MINTAKIIPKATKFLNLNVKFLALNSAQAIARYAAHIYCSPYFNNHSESRRTPSSGMWRSVVLLRTDVSEESIASVVRVGETLVAANISSSRFLFALMMQVVLSSETLVPTRAARHHILEDGILNNHRRETSDLTFRRSLNRAPCLSLPYWNSLSIPYFLKTCH